MDQKSRLIRVYTKLVVLCLVAVFLMPTTLFAAGKSNVAATRYPIVLAHGMGASAEILGILDYWWGLEDVLRDEGADVYITSVNGMDSTAAKAADFKQQYLEILAISGKEKANIIGHSHGTIYTRYAVSNLGLGDNVASHTSIAGPHRGSVIADVILGLVPDSLEWLVGDTLDFIYAFIFGDKNPDSLQNGYDLTRTNMINNFNPNTPNVAGVYYQSWAAKIKTMAINARNWYFIGTWPILLLHEGSNDGLVSVNSAKWGNFRGVEDASWYSAGCDHLNIIDQPFGITPGFDRDEFYLELVAELKNMGY
ncbi:MAG: alpha/beta fold hydrolase [Proteobacteria bacterium]|nr:alpha/beta fold hydrolase [Pseudomonadota bacterium]